MMYVKCLTNFGNNSGNKRSKLIEIFHLTYRLTGIVTPVISQEQIVLFDHHSITNLAININKLRFINKNTIDLKVKLKEETCSSSYFFIFKAANVTTLVYLWSSSEQKFVNKVKTLTRVL